MATIALDLPYLSTYANISEPDLLTLVQNPSTELVTSFLEQIIIKAQDYERLKADRLRADVELENAVRNGELHARTLKANVDKALAEAQALRKQLNEEGWE